MATNMNSLSPAQQAMVDKIIASGQQVGAPNVVIQAAVIIANAESDFDSNQPGKTSHAYGLFQYMDTVKTPTWTNSWRSFVRKNPSNPLSKMTVSAAKKDVDAQIQVMYADLNRMYAGYDQGKIAHNYLPGGNLYSVTQKLQANGIDIKHNFLNYAYLRHNTDPNQITAIVNTVFTSGNLAATQNFVGTIGLNPVSGTSLAIPNQPADAGLHYVEINGPTQVGRLYDNGVFYTKDTPTGIENWSVPTANGGKIDTTQYPNGQVAAVQYNFDAHSGAYQLDTSAANIQEYLQQQIQEIGTAATQPSDLQTWQGGLQELNTVLANDPAAVITDNAGNLSITAGNSQYELTNNQLTQTIQSGSITTQYNYNTATLNGQPPLNQASADAGLNGIAPGQLASGAIAANDDMFMKRRVA